MGTDLISNLQKSTQKIATLRDRAEQHLKKGYVFEPIPNSELSVWFSILRFFTRLIGLNLAPPKRKRNFSESERYNLEKKIKKLEIIGTQVNFELLRAKQNPTLRWIPPNLIDYRGDGYPEDWEQISLQYRRKVSFICEDCGEYALGGHVHHIMPVSRGGDSSEDNLLFLCKYCHSLQHPHMKVV